MPFYKFGNYGEGYADTINWETAKVLEKVDGALIKVWYHNDRWHVSTNGTIDAYSADTFCEDLSYGQLFEKALGDKLEAFYEVLSPHYVYMFELVSPINQMTIFYPETKLYLIGARFMPLWLEVDTTMFSFLKELGIEFPKYYSLDSLEKCLETVKDMSFDEEGFVVVDSNYHRIKIKSEEYLKKFHFTNNNSISEERVIKMLRDESLDDFLAYCPQYKDFVDRVLTKYEKLKNDILTSYFNSPLALNMELLGSRAVFAAYAKEDPHKDFLFSKYDNPKLTVDEWLNSLYLSRLLRKLENL
jgi:hypothetical protein